MSDTKTPPANPKPAGAIIHDGELAAINRICKQLTALDDDGCDRVVSYIINRFGQRMLHAHLAVWEMNHKPEAAK